MRCAVVAGLALVILPVAAIAQPGPYSAIVIEPEARLRAGPGDKFPETGAISKGTRVMVDHEEPDGWLAIEAPYGQVSWVQTQFVEGFDPAKPVPQRVDVSLDTSLTEGEINLWCGQVGIAKPIGSIRRVKIPNGTILLVIGPAEKIDGKSWYPISPPYLDFRYIPKASVQPGATPKAAFVVRSEVTLGTPVSQASATTPTPPVTTPAPQPDQAPSTPPAPPPPPAVNHPLWMQAEAAEKEGRFDDAEKLYFQLARVINDAGGDADIPNRCYTRIHLLRQKKRGQAGSGASLPPTPASPSVVSQPVVTGSTSVASLPAATASGGGTTTTSTRPVSTPDRPTLLPPIRADGQGSAVADGPQWTGPGVLKGTAVVLDGRPTYALETKPGEVTLYVVGGKEVDLRVYLNRRVDLYGTIQRHRDVSKRYVIVTKVDPNPSP